MKYRKLVAGFDDIETSISVKLTKGQKRKQLILSSTFFILCVIVACTTFAFNYSSFVADPFKVKYSKRTSRYMRKNIRYVAKMQAVFNENEKEQNENNLDRIIHEKSENKAKSSAEHFRYDMRGYPVMSNKSNYIYLSMLIDPVLTQDLVFLSESLGFLYVIGVKYVRYRGENKNDACISFTFRDLRFGDFYVESKFDCDEIMLALTNWADTARVFHVGTKDEMEMYHSEYEYDFLAIKYYNEQPMHLELLEIKDTQVVNINYIITMVAIHDTEDPTEHDKHWTPLECKFITADNQYLLASFDQRFILEHIDYNLRVYNKIFVLHGIVGKEKDNIVYDSTENTLIHSVDENDAMFHSYEIVFKNKGRKKFRYDSKSPEFAFDAMIFESDLEQYCMKMIIVINRVNSHYVLYADSHCELLRTMIEYNDQRKKGEKNILYHFKQLNKEKESISNDEDLYL